MLEVEGTVSKVTRVGDLYRSTIGVQTRVGSLYRSTIGVQVDRQTSESTDGVHFTTGRQVVPISEEVSWRRSYKSIPTWKGPMRCSMGSLRSLVVLTDRCPLSLCPYKHNFVGGSLKLSLGGDPFEVLIFTL